MPPLFNPRLVNSPDRDPGLFIPFFFNKRAVMIDPGNVNALSPKDILKLSHLLISHTHMDHFAGFDQVLRILLGRDKTLSVFGPEGIIDNVRGKFSGYTWNLVENYPYSLSVHVCEVLPEKIISCRFSCNTRFKSSEKKIIPLKSGIIFRDTAFEVTAAILDHGIPCIGYSLKEYFHVNIRADALKQLGLKPGRWLYDFKTAVMAGMAPETPVSAPLADEPGKDKKTAEYTLGELANLLTVITPGEKITYITDVAGSNENIEKITGLSQNSDHLFIEAAFLDKDRNIAKKKNHLTAFQAGMIAAKANAKRFTLFHFSPRYTGAYDLFYEEAERAFMKFGGEPVPR